MCLNFFNTIFDRGPVASVHLFFNGLNEQTNDLIMFHKSGSKLIELSSQYGFKSIEQVLSKLVDRPPIILTINGHCVLNKIISSGTYPEKESIISNFFPGAKARDFNVQVTQLSEDSLYIASIIRAEILNEIIELIKVKNLNLQNIYLGPFNLNLVLNYGSYKELKVGNIELVTNGSEICDVKYNLNESNHNSDIFKNNDPFNSRNVIPFSSVVANVIHKGKTRIDNEHLISSINQFTSAKRKLRTLSGVISFLIVLIVVDQVTGWYLIRKEKMLSLSLVSSQSKQVESSKEQHLKELKYGLLKEKGFMSQDNLVYLGNTIAQGLPDNILLSELKLNPLNFSRTDSALVISSNLISLNGKCESDFYLNQWLSKLKKETWVKNISEIYYKYDKEDKTGKFNLSIQY